MIFKNIFKKQKKGKKKEGEVGKDKGQKEELLKKAEEEKIGGKKEKKEKKGGVKKKVPGEAEKSGGILVRKKDNRTFAVLVKPWLTEKSSRLMPLSQYVFQVDKRTNKQRIKRAVEETYNVKVEKVRIVNIPRKKKSLGRFNGWKPSFKKAVVTLGKGHKIEIMPQ